MKKLLFVVISLGLLVSACLPTPAAQPTQAPVSQEELNATAAVLAQLTLQAIPTPSIAPSDTPVVMTATNTLMPVTPTETENPLLLTLTATLGTGTTTPGTPETPTGTSPATPSETPTLSTPVGTSQPLHYGTMPPYLPAGTITLINKAKRDVYISLQCTTKDGGTSIIEYPVVGSIKTKAPAGRYFYVAWVGGKQMTGSFGLEARQDLTIKIYPTEIQVK